jgi:hypothetical protein
MEHRIHKGLPQVSHAVASLVEQLNYHISFFSSQLFDPYMIVSAKDIFCLSHPCTICSTSVGP